MSRGQTVLTRRSFPGYDNRSLKYWNRSIKTGYRPSYYKHQASRDVSITRQLRTWSLAGSKKNMDFSTREYVRPGYVTTQYNGGKGLSSMRADQGYASTNVSLAWSPKGTGLFRLHTSNTVTGSGNHNSFKINRYTGKTRGTHTRLERTALGYTARGRRPPEKFVSRASETRRWRKRDFGSRRPTQAPKLTRAQRQAIARSRRRIKGRFA